MTTTYKSDQLVNVDTVPTVKRQANEKGKLHAVFFSFTTHATLGLAIGENVEIARLPVDARPVWANIGGEAMSTAGGTAGIQIGDGTTVDKFLEESSCDAAFNIPFFNRPGRQGGVALTGDTSIVVTAATEAWAAGKIVRGSIHYIKE